MSALYERDHFLSGLHTAVESATRGNGRAVFVCGEAGIGKTTLLEAFVARLRTGRVLWGGCEALSTPRPFGPLYDMAHSASTLRSVLAIAHNRPLLFTAVLEELSRSPTPVVMVIEDIHWADAATLDFIKFVGRRIHRFPAVLIVSYRDDELSSAQLRPLLGEIPANQVVRFALPAIHFRQRSA